MIYELWFMISGNKKNGLLIRYQGFRRPTSTNKKVRFYERLLTLVLVKLSKF